jgi:iron complex transport system ATP-binding protein
LAGRAAKRIWIKFWRYWNCSDVVRKNGISAVMAIHDLNLASRYTDRILMMNEGRIFAAGDPASVLTVENIRQVYGVEVLVKSDGENPYIIPLRPIN